MRFLTIVMSAVLMMTSCGTRPSQPSSKLNVDIRVPVNQINSQGLRELMQSLETIVNNGAKGTLSISQLLAVIPFTESELGVIHQSRSAQADISCAGNICVGTNSGGAMEIDASQMNIPTIGVPHIAIAEDIEFKFRVDTKNVIDICSITGFSVRKLVFWSELHAANVKLDENNQATQAVITASPTSYRRCD